MRLHKRIHRVYDVSYIQDITFLPLCKSCQRQYWNQSDVKSWGLKLNRQRQGKKMSVRFGGLVSLFPAEVSLFPA